MASGYSITISAADKASATIDSVNRRLKALTAPAERLNKSLARFGDVSGINRLGEGMQSLAGQSLNAFRSVDRLAPALGALTSAGSLAGMSKLIQRWTQLGEQTYLTGQRLSMPTDRLTALRGAARLAGASAEDMDAGLTALDEKLRGATFARDPEATRIFAQLGVSFGVAGKQARTAGDAIGDVADAIKTEFDVHGRGAAEQAAHALGLDALFPLLIKGRAGMQALSAEAARLGGVIPPDAAKRADELHTSFERVAIAADGVLNRLGDKWGQRIKPYLDGVSDVIAKNQAMTDSFAQTGIGITAFSATFAAALKWAPTLARFLPMGLAASVSGDTDPSATREGAPPEWLLRPNISDLWSRYAPKFLGGDAGFSPQTISVPAKGTAAWSRASQLHDFWKSKGLTEPQIAGIEANVAQESGFDPGAWNADHTSYGLYQYTGPRLDALRKRYGDAPTAEQQNEYANWEMTAGPEKFWRDTFYSKATSPEEAGRAFTGFERPADMMRRAQERAAAAPKFYGAFDGPAAAGGSGGLVVTPTGGAAPGDGHVRVDINLNGAPPGTTARAQSSGAVAVTPPRITTRMPGF